jgi:trehalose-phosphatase
MLCTSELVNQRLVRAKRLWLFLDYDGTLADFAPTPEHVDLDLEVIDVLTRLAQRRDIRVAVVSGRQLGQIRLLLPVPGVLLAGTYGIELQTPGGRRIERVASGTIRPVLDDLKPRWERLIAGREGFFLEDKYWALALHARFADDDQANIVLEDARRMATDAASLGPFRLLGGHKFLEIGPRLSNKGQTVAYLLDHYPWPGALPVYLGDDDKDEEAFGVIKARGGVAILVAREPRNTQADCRLASPRAVRHWLQTFEMGRTDT